MLLIVFPKNGEHSAHRCVSFFTAGPAGAGESTLRIVVERNEQHEERRTLCASSRAPQGLQEWEDTLRIVGVEHQEHEERRETLRKAVPVFPREEREDSAQTALPPP